MYVPNVNMFYIIVLLGIKLKNNQRRKKILKKTRIKLKWNKRWKKSNKNKLLTKITHKNKIKLIQYKI